MQTMLWQLIFLGMSVQEVAAVNRTFTSTVSESAVYAMLRRYDETGVVDYPPPKERCKRMDGNLEQVMLEIVSDNPWLFLDEIADTLFARTGERFSREYIHGALHAAGYTLKKMQRIAAARDEQQRQHYWDVIRSWVTHPSQLVFGDETGMDERTARRKWGWGARGTRVNVTAVQHSGKHYSILALFGTEGFLAFRFVEGGYTTDLFMEHIVDMIAYAIHPYPGPQSILVLDNCRIHHAEERALRAAVEARGGILFFLAPYCCIDNPEEYAFSVFKNSWKRHALQLRGVAFEHAVSWCLQNCYAHNTSKRKDNGPLNTYTRCGYVFP